MCSDFVHLRVHSEYSLKDSIIRIDSKNRANLITACKDSQQSAVAITDEVNLFSAVTFYKYATKNKIKPIIGAELWVKKDTRLFLMPFLAMNNKGYKQLCTLISSSWINPKINELAVIDFSELAGNSSDLIALCGGLGGAISSFALKEEVMLSEEVDSWLSLFEGRFYLEIHRVGIDKEELWIKNAVALSQQYNIPLVATNKACFLEPLDFHAHEARVSINRRTTVGSDELEGLYTNQQYFRSTTEMVELFADLPVALENTVLIAKRCNVEGILGEVKMPDFDIEGDDLLGYFKRVTQEGLEARLKDLKISEPEKIKIYQDRLVQEINVISTMNYIGYFLIVADFIRWAKEQAIPVGPGRGSGAASLVAYSLKITDIDPIEFDLIFERFLNNDRKSMPDFDIDFCVEGRDRVIDYVVDKYGASQVAQIITFGTLSARAVVRDVARVLAMPYSVGDMISKLIPDELEITIEQAFVLSKEFKSAYNTDEEVAEVVDMSIQLEGLVRNVGKHAGGIVIAPSNIEDYCPIYVHPENQSRVTQFHKDALEDIGLVKFDFLGLKNLTTIDYAVKLINSMAQKGGEEGKSSTPFSIDNIPYDDPNVYKMFSRGDTMGIFQVESPALTRYIMMLKPTNLIHLTDMLALYRPGPLGAGMVDTYMKHHQGEKREDLPHPDLHSILDSTEGVIIYQEQVMKIAQKLANFSLGQADVLRQAMGKKDQQKMEQLKVTFINNAEKNNINVNVAEHIYSDMSKFAEYGFNKAHSVSYAVVTYQTAYLKYYYPTAYMAALMSLDSGSQERLFDLKKTSERLGVKLSITDINTSEHQFVPVGKNNLCWSLAAIKGVGRLVAEQITLERYENGNYKDFFDFCRRVGKREKSGSNKGLLSKRVLEMLIYAGVFDRLHSQRELLLANIERGINYTRQVALDEAMGQGDLFSTVSTDVQTPSYLPTNDKLHILQLLSYEKKIIGIYLDKSPYKIFYKEVKNYGVYSIEDFLKIREGYVQDKSQRKNYVVLGEIEKFRVKRTMKKDRKQKGKNTQNTNVAKDVADTSTDKNKEKLSSIVEILLGDGKENLECVIYNEELQNDVMEKKWLSKQKLLVFTGIIKYDKVTDSNALEVTNVWSIEEMRNNLLEKIVLRTNRQNVFSLQEKFDAIMAQTKSIEEQEAAEEVSDIFGSSTKITEVPVEVRINTEQGEVTFGSANSIPFNNLNLSLLLAEDGLGIEMARKGSI